jgi:hypothetical protein
MREAFLIAVKIDGADPLTILYQRDGDVHGDRRLT